MSDDAPLFIGVGLALAVVLGLLIWAAIAEERACTSAGGKLLSKPSTGVGITGNGQVAVTTNTVTFCVSSDGRILF